MNFLIRYKKVIMRIILALVVSCAFVGGCSYINKRVGLNDDNVIEEALETQIDEYTGMDIDLSPNTPETKR